MANYRYKMNSFLSKHRVHDGFKVKVSQINLIGELNFTLMLNEKLNISGLR